jgi:hypothetical protein
LFRIQAIAAEQDFACQEVVFMKNPSLQGSGGGWSWLNSNACFRLEAFKYRKIFMFSWRTIDSETRIRPQVFDDRLSIFRSTLPPISKLTLFRMTDKIVYGPFDKLLRRLRQVQSASKWTKCYRETVLSSS